MVTGDLRGTVVLLSTPPVVWNGAGMARRARFRDVLAVGEFRALWVAELLSVIGDQLARVALAVLVYQRTASAGLTALTYALTFVPALLGSTLLGGLADRYPRRDLMVGAYLARGLLAGAMVLPFLPIPALLALVFLLTFAGGPFKAAQLALLPTVLPGEKYVTGLSLRMVTGQSAQLAGFLGGGLLLTVLDPRLALGLNAATFLFAAIIVALGVQHRPGARAGAGVDGNTTGTARLLWRDRRLRGLVALSWLVGLFIVPEGLAAPYAASLAAAAVAVGLLMAADPAGSIVGAWLISRIPERSRSALMTPLAIAAGVPLALCLTRPGLAVSVVLWAISGACSTACLIVAQASFNQRVPDHHRGAANGLAGAGLWSSQGLAILGGGLLADATSPVLAIASTGAAGTILTVFVGVSWLRTRSSGDVVSGRSGDGHPDSSGTKLDLTSRGSWSAPPPAEHAAKHGSGGADQVIIAPARNGRRA
jgi:MFS family permease